MYSFLVFAFTLNLDAHTSQGNKKGSMGFFFLLMNRQALPIFFQAMILQGNIKRLNLVTIVCEVK